MPNNNVVISIPGPKFDHPLCAEVDPNLFFPEEDEDTIMNGNRTANQGTYIDAKKICDKCDHVNECAAWAIEHEATGFWGGLSPNQRRTMRRRLNIRLSIPY